MMLSFDSILENSFRPKVFILNFLVFDTLKRLLNDFRHSLAFPYPYFVVTFRLAYEADVLSVKPSA